MDAAVTLLTTAALTLAALRHIYRGGKTLNDHIVALLVSGCIWIYPLLWWGTHQAGLTAQAQLLLAPLLLAGATLIYALFFILDRDVDPGPLLQMVGRMTQPAYAFSLWTGLLLVFWTPTALLLGSPPLWPGWLLLGPLGLAAWGTVWTYARHEQRLVHELPASCGPLRVVQISDLHASPLMAGGDMARLAATVNQLQPDLVAVTGDLIMPFSEKRHGYLVEALASIEAPVLCCPGNHDLPIRDQLKAELEAEGVRFLVDERDVLSLRGVRVEVLGLDFRWRGAQAATEQVLGDLPDDGAGYRILLAHDPRYFRWVPPERFDLVLSGHTHGGQLGSNMFGLRASALGVLGLYDQGFFQRGQCRLYVHRGNWHTGFPPRMGIASEVAVFEIGGEG